MLFRAFLFLFIIYVLYIYIIYPLSQGRQAPPTRLTVDSRRRHTLARRSMSLPLKKFSSQDKLRSAHRPPSRHRRHRDHHTRILLFSSAVERCPCLNLENSQLVKAGCSSSG